LLDGDIACEVEREAIRIPQMEGPIAGDDGFAVCTKLRHQVVEDAEAGRERTLEALFLVGDGLLDEALLGAQVGVVPAHLLDHRGRYIRQERLVEPNQLAKAGGAAQDHAQHIAAALIARQDAVADEEGHGAAVVGDGAIAEQMLPAVRVALAEELLDAIHDRAKRIRVVIVVLALHDTGQPLQSRACVDARCGQGNHLSAGLLIKLHEDQIPDLQVFVVVIDASLVLRGQVAPVVVDLRVRAAGTGIAHGPPVVLLAEAENAVRRHPDVNPQALGFVVVFEDRKPKPLQGQLPAVDQQVPGVLNGLALEVIAKRKVAQHLEERVVPWAWPDVVEIVVLTADAHALLAGGRALIGSLLHAQEDIFELDHAGVDQQQRWIVAGNEAAALYKGVAIGAKVLEEVLTDLIGR